MKLNYLLAGLLLLGLFSCKSKSSNDDAIAKELCACLQPMIAMYQKMEAQANNGDADAMIEAMQELETLAGDSQACTDRLTEKYGDLADRQEGLESAMQKNCPEVMKVLREFSEAE